MASTRLAGFSVNLMSRGFRGISSQPAQPSAPVFHDPLDNGSAPLFNRRPVAIAVFSGSSVGQDRSSAATCPACYRHSL